MGTDNVKLNGGGKTVVVHNGGTQPPINGGVNVVVNPNGIPGAPGDSHNHINPWAAAGAHMNHWMMHMPPPKPVWQTVLEIVGGIVALIILGVILKCCCNIEIYKED